MIHRPLVSACAWAAAVMLSACASLLPPTQVHAPVAQQWQAPLPHQGTPVALAQWWQNQGDPLLARWIEAAQAASPSIAQAQARIASARATQAQAHSALLPNVGAQAGASRSVSTPQAPALASQSVQLQASWEVDLVGAGRAANHAAQAQVQSAQAQWHEARVSVAAEVATLYYSLSACQQALQIAQADAQSRQETARLTQITAQAGLTGAANVALAQAGAAQAQSQLKQQSAQCDSDIKALVALTALTEPALQAQWAARTDKTQHIPAFAISRVPAQAISQRPDVYSAERDVVQASAQVGSAWAQRLPRLSLSGSIGALRLSSAGTSDSGNTWSFGPLALALPVFDAGLRAATLQAAQAAYSAAVVVYQAKVRQAVREVEQALVLLDSAQVRREHVDTAARGYAQSLQATQARYNQGLASLMELEEARRYALTAQLAQANWRLEHNLAWLALYRAVGGGFEPDSVPTPVPTSGPGGA